MKIGITTGNMKVVHGMWPNFVDGTIVDAEVTEDLAGSLKHNDGPDREYFSGQFEIMIYSNVTGEADYAFIESVWAHKGNIYFDNQFSVRYLVTWTGPLVVTWSDSGANLCRIPFEFTEVL